MNEWGMLEAAGPPPSPVRDQMPAKVYRRPGLERFPCPIRDLKSD